MNFEAIVYAYVFGFLGMMLAFSLIFEETPTLYQNL